MILDKSSWSKSLLAVWIGVCATPCFAVAESYAVWSEPEADDANIYMSMLSNDKWDSARKITDGGVNLTPAISVDRNEVTWIVWVQISGEHRYLNYSIIRGNDLSQGRVLSSSDERSYSPSIIIDHSNIPWLAWASDSGTDEDIFYSRWNGSEWDAPQQINQDDNYPDITPTIGLGTDGKPWISWLGFNGDRYDTYTVHWLQKNWSTEKQTRDTNLIQREVKNQKDGIPDLPAQSSKRLMGSVFVRNGGEIQSLSERIVPFGTREE